MKITKTFFLILVVLVLILPPFSATATTEVLDQENSCTTAVGDNLNNAANFPMYQVFRPSVNRLTRISLGTLGGTTASITLTIKDSGGQVLGSASRSIDEGWFDFIFSSPITVIAGLNYQIHLSHNPASSNNWGYCQPGSYSGGYAVTGGVIIPDKDYLFKTYGYNIATPTPTPTSTLAPPKNLEAEDVADDNGGKIKLDWTKSTTSGVDGYNIYRKGEEAQDFTKIDKVNYKTYAYEDSGLENGKEYSYVVRTYLGESESADSNEARAVPENNLAPSTPQNLRIISKGEDYLEISWDKVEDEKLEKYVVLWGENPNDFMTENEVSKDDSNFRAENLKSKTRYYFRLASEGKDSQRSGVSDLLSEETLGKKQGLSWVWILSIVVLALGLIGLYLYIAYLKKWWPFRKNLKSQISNSKSDVGDVDEIDIKELPGKKAKWDR